MKKTKKLLLPLLCLIALICTVPTYSLNIEQIEYQSENNQEEVSNSEDSLTKSEEEKNDSNNQSNLIASNNEEKAQLEDSVTTTNEKSTTQINTSEKTVPNTSQTSENITTTKSTNEKLGTLGRLYIPSINLDVAVYYANVWNDENYNAQTIVDRSDSAAFYELGKQYIIADHNYQGFKKLENVQIGTTAYIKLQDGSIINLRAKDKFIGKNLSYDLVDSSNTSIQDMDKSLIMYTCYNNNKDIIVTRWELA